MTRPHGRRKKAPALPEIGALFQDRYGFEERAARRRAQQQGGQAASARARAGRNVGVELLDQLTAAHLGDDSLLLPYQPTNTVNPDRPRTLAAGYDKDSRTLRVRFRDGTPWAYYDVPPRVWRNFKRVQSPGRFINRVLNSYAYSRDDF